MQRTVDIRVAHSPSNGTANLNVWLRRCRRLGNGYAERDHRSSCAEDDEFGAEPAQAIANRRYDDGSSPRLVGWDFVLVLACVSMNKSGRYLAIERLQLLQRSESVTAIHILRRLAERIVEHRGADEALLRYVPLTLNHEHHTD